jgi:hypothetical protein
LTQRRIAQGIRRHPGPNGGLLAPRVVLALLIVAPLAPLARVVSEILGAQSLEELLLRPVQIRFASGIDRGN